MPDIKVHGRRLVFEGKAGDWHADVNLLPYNVPCLFIGMLSFPWTERNTLYPMVMEIPGKALNVNIKSVNPRKTRPKIWAHDFRKCHIVRARRRQTKRIDL